MVLPSPFFVTFCLSFYYLCPPSYAFPHIRQNVILPAKEGRRKREGILDLQKRGGGGEKISGGDRIFSIFFFFYPGK